VPDHRPPAGGPGRGPDRNRPPVPGRLAAPDPGARPGGQRLPPVPLHEKNPVIPNGGGVSPAPAFTASGAAPARTRPPRRRRGR
jgi:hypothetical protein